MISCLYCQNLLTDININPGNGFVSGHCKPCHAWYLYENGKLSLMSLSSRGCKKAACYISQYENVITISSFSWKIKIPLTWIFPSIVDELIIRYSKLKAFF